MPENHVTALNLLSTARRVLTIESEALQILSERIHEEFLEVVELLDRCRGKIIVTGLGKSGIAAKKIAATLASTGSPAIFLHSAEAGHGDLGVVSSGDVLITLSYSGETKELVELVPRVKLLGVPVVALTGNTASTLAKLADSSVDVGVPTYPWPYGLIPTASYAATVAIGDAIAIVLLVKRGMKEDDFAKLHPGGLLGGKLLVRVEELMHTGNELPVVSPGAAVREVLMEMTAKRLGVACVANSDGKLLGLFTDGDLRRLLHRSANPLDMQADQVMTTDPKYTAPGVLSAEVLHRMEEHKITSLPVLDEQKRLIGIVHMHDILNMEVSA